MKLLTLSSAAGASVASLKLASRASAIYLRLHQTRLASVIQMSGAEE